MRICKMTATFGKLEGQTLTLEPGLNIITAPNEWGKSTWCAFLTAMLYGLDTRSKTTKTTLADKERFAPWSGSPMEGRIDLNWNGRDITIQRHTASRVPLGQFSAFETASGLPVPELTAANCGQLLLGVEQSVFRRAGFIRQSDLPVTQDEALRRRLNALVTTGDESDGGDLLAEKLKELKNRCRYNKTGLIPQTEARLRALEETIAELDALDAQRQALILRLDELKAWQNQLHNHRNALAFAAAAANAGQISAAKEARDRVRQQLLELEAVCAGLPSREEAEEALNAFQSLREQWSGLLAKKHSLPPAPMAPTAPEPFSGLPIEKARQMLQQDSRRFQAALRTKLPLILVALSLFGLLGAGTLLALKIYIPGGIAVGAALAALLWGLYERNDSRRTAKSLAKKYGSIHPERWAAAFEKYEAQLAHYQSVIHVRGQTSDDLDSQYLLLQRRQESLCGGQDPESVLEYWKQVQVQWDDLEALRRDAQREQLHFEAMQSLSVSAHRPDMPDTLTCSDAETTHLLKEASAEQQRLQNRLGQYQGRMENLGSRQSLQSELEVCRSRLSALESTYSALSIALETLADARAELQRRFAPRIARRAQELMETMTGGRYHSLTMDSDFSLRAGADGEAILRDLLWRSDGTMDQLYLCLRLAVAEALTPESPLILDDALVRFDDTRMASAVSILRELSQSRQIICFTCQGREASV